MLNDIANEFLKIVRQKKNYIAMVGHFVLMTLCVIGVSRTADLHRMTNIDRMGISLSDFQQFLDGLFFARTMIVPSFMIIMPILVCTVAGDLIAGEVQDGSMRLYAARPRGRLRIVFSKIIAMYVFCMGFCIYFGVAGLVSGYLFFGWQNTQIIPLLDLGLGTDLEILSSSQAMARYWLVTAYYGLSVLTLGCITLFFSSIFNRMTSATVAGITLYFVSYIFENLPLLVSWRPYFLSHVMNACALFWLDPVPSVRIVFNLLVLLAYVLVFSAATIIVFKNKDI